MGWANQTRKAQPFPAHRRVEQTRQRFKSHVSAQLFRSMRPMASNIFNTQRHPIARQALRIDRAEAMKRWMSDAVVHDT